MCKILCFSHNATESDLFIVTFFILYHYLIFYHDFQCEHPLSNILSFVFQINCRIIKKLFFWGNTKLAVNIAVMVFQRSFLNISNPHNLRNSSSFKIQIKYLSFFIGKLVYTRTKIIIIILHNNIFVLFNEAVIFSLNTIRCV